MTIRVLIADDHPVFRHRLRSALAGVEEVDVVGEATDGPAAAATAVEQRVDVVLMDLHMPGGSGIDASRDLARAAPGVAVLALTMLDSDESLFTAVRAGARGYLVKGAELDQIIRAVRSVYGGDVGMPPAERR